MLLIPLSANASRGDQILNARPLKAATSMVLEEETLQDQLLLDTVNRLYDNRQAFIDAMSKGGSTDSIEKILQLIRECQK